MGLSNALQPLGIGTITSKPSALEWSVAIFVVIIQQNAFIWLPKIFHSDSSISVRDVDSPYNTYGIILSMVLIAILSYPLIRRIGLLALTNLASVLFIVLAIGSSLWSLHPDLSFRRGAGYFLTLLIAAYIPVRFNVDDVFKVLSRSFAISAVGSILFVAVFPQQGIMSGGELEGNWQGVFPHKNVLGFVMAVAVLCELNLIVTKNGRIVWRLCWLCVYFGLVLLSRSTTALLMALLYIAVAFIYIIWLRNKAIAYAVSLLSFVLLVGAGISVWTDPEGVLDIFGKDATLTGRTGVWIEVLQLINEKPLLGWGYRAMWLPDDSPTITVDTRNQNWGVPSAHNAFLEVALELGLIGLFVILMIIAIALWRALKCCVTGVLPLGIFSMALFMGTVTAGGTIETVGLNQEIYWLVFNILAFACGQSLWSQKKKRPGRYRPGRFIGREQPAPPGYDAAQSP